MLIFVSSHDNGTLGCRAKQNFKTSKYTENPTKPNKNAALGDMLNTSTVSGA